MQPTPPPPQQSQLPKNPPTLLHRRTAPQVSSTTTLLLFLLTLLCFFPSVFHLLWSLPLRLIIPAPSSPSETDNPLPPPISPPSVTMWTQKQLSLPSRSRGSYLITDEVVSQLPEI